MINDGVLWRLTQKNASVDLNWLLDSIRIGIIVALTRSDEKEEEEYRHFSSILIRQKIIHSIK